MKVSRIAGLLSCAFIALIAIDLALTAVTGWAMGWCVPLALSSATGLLGLLILAYAARYFWTVIDSNEFRTGTGSNPDDASIADDRILGNLALSLAGILLLLPGPITDLLGLALLIPAVRHRTARAAMRLLD
jgi:UPF0716 protein FxsA